MSSVNLSTNYEGKFAGSFLAPAVLGGKMIEQGLMNRFIGVKSKMNVPLMKLNGVIQAYAVNFNAAADTVLISDKALDPQKLTVNLEFPVDVLEQMYLSEQMLPGTGNSAMPQDFQEFIMAYTARVVGRDMDKFIWNSDTSSSGVYAQFDGLIKQLTADAAVLDQVIVALTAANIVEEMNKVYAKIPEDASEDPGMKLFMSVGAHKLYKQAVASQGLNTTDKKTRATSFIDENIEVVSVAGFPANTIVAASTSNLVFGTDLESDMQRFEVVDMRYTTADNKVRIRMDFKADVKYGFGEQVVLAKTA